MLIKFEMTCRVHDSFRVQQIAGMFDVPLADKLREQFTLDLPDEFVNSLPYAPLQRSDFSLQRSPLTTDHQSEIRRGEPLATAWQLGLILGPSASGKTTLARGLFGPNLIEQFHWPTDRAIIDRFPSTSSGPGGGMSIREITSILTSVGLSSPPVWIKPFQVLSTGEQFRANLARAIVVAVEESKSGKVEKSLRRFNSSTFGPCPLVAIDEFTSSLDRRVACLASAALAKSIRTGRIPVRFVAITCHADILRWLAPDWTIDMSTRQFTWHMPRPRTSDAGSKIRRGEHRTRYRRSLHRPKIHLTLHRCTRDHWPAFARHHYLTGALNRAARCFLVRDCTSSLTPGYPLGASSLPAVAFCATLAIIGRRNHYRASRLVVLPDYQGLGIGPRILEAVADLHRREGQRLNITASHPALIAHCRASPHWRTVKIMPTGIRPSQKFAAIYRGSTLRAVVSFEYVAQLRSCSARRASRS